MQALRGHIPVTAPSIARAAQTGPKVNGLRSELGQQHVLMMATPKPTLATLPQKPLPGAGVTVSSDTCGALDNRRHLSPLALAYSLALQRARGWQSLVSGSLTASIASQRNPLQRCALTTRAVVRTTVPQ